MHSIGSDSRSLSSVSFFLIEERASLKVILGLFPQCGSISLLQSWPQTFVLAPVC